MAFGMLVPTTNGPADVVDMRAARLVHVQSSTSNTGTITRTGFVIDNGFIYRRWNGDPSLAILDFKWVQSSQQLSWTTLLGSNPGFTVYFFLTR